MISYAEAKTQQSKTQQMGGVENRDPSPTADDANRITFTQTKSDGCGSFCERLSGNHFKSTRGNRRVRTNGGVIGQLLEEAEAQLANTESKIDWYLKEKEKQQEQIQRLKHLLSQSLK